MDKEGRTTEALKLPCQVLQELQKGQEEVTRPCVHVCQVSDPHFPNLVFDQTMVTETLTSKGSIKLILIILLTLGINGASRLDH